MVDYVTKRKRLLEKLAPLLPGDVFKEIKKLVEKEDYGIQIGSERWIFDLSGSHYNCTSKRIYGYAWPLETKKIETPWYRGRATRLVAKRRVSVYVEEIYDETQNPPTYGWVKVLIPGAKPVIA